MFFLDEPFVSALCLDGNFVPIGSDIILIVKKLESWIDVP